MTREEFQSIGWTRDCVVRDNYGHEGHILTVFFECGVIHYDDDVKKCSFGRSYKELAFIGKIPKK